MLATLYQSYQQFFFNYFQIQKDEKKEEKSGKLPTQKIDQVDRTCKFLEKYAQEIRKKEQCISAKNMRNVQNEIELIV